MRRVPAILIVVFLACPLLFAAFIAISLSTWTLDRSFYLSVVGDPRLFEIPDAVSSASWSNSVVEGTGGLTWHALGRAAGAVLTPDYLRGQAAAMINQLFDSLNGKTRRFEISVDTAPVKAALMGDAGRRFSRFLAEDLPTGGSAADFTVRPGHLPASRPASVSVERAAALIQAGLPTFVSTIPDTMRIDTGSRFFLPGALVFGDVILLLIAGGFLAAAAFIGGATPFERLQWFGWPLLAPAAGVVLIGLLILVSSFSWVTWGIESARLDIHGFSASFITALINAARTAVSRIGVGFLATGGIAAGASLGLLTWSWSMRTST